MEWMLLPLKRYAEFSGRSRRMEFWMYNLGIFLFFLILTVIAFTIGLGAAGFAGRGDGRMAAGMIGMFATMGIFGLVIGIAWLALIIPSLAVAVRRLHDTDRSGWWLFLYFGPYIVSTALNFSAISSGDRTMMGLAGVIGLVGFIGAIVLLVFYCLPGTNGPNRFGPDPMGNMGNLGDTFA